MWSDVETPWQLILHCYVSHGEAVTKKMWTWKTKLTKQPVTVSKTRLHPLEQQLKLLKNIWLSSSLFQVFYFKIRDYETTSATENVFQLRYCQQTLFIYWTVSEAELIQYWLSFPHGDVDVRERSTCWGQKWIPIFFPPHCFRVWDGLWICPNSPWYLHHVQSVQKHMYVSVCWLACWKVSANLVHSA